MTAYTIGQLASAANVPTSTVRFYERAALLKPDARTGGNYRAVLQLFGMEAQDYKRLMNFLAAHDCAIDYREFRQPRPDALAEGNRDRSRRSGNRD